MIDPTRNIVSATFDNDFTTTSVGDSLYSSTNLNKNRMSGILFCLKLAWHTIYWFAYISVGIPVGFATWMFLQFSPLYKYFQSPELICLLSVRQFTFVYEHINLHAHGRIHFRDCGYKCVDFIVCYILIRENNCVVNSKKVQIPYLQYLAKLLRHHVKSVWTRKENFR